MAIILNNNPNPFAIQFNLQNCSKVYWNENLVWPELDKQYFWLKSNSNDSLVYDYKTYSGPNITKTIKYSFDGDTWTTYTNPVSLTAGQTIYLRSETADSFYDSNPYISVKGLSLTNDSTFTVGGNVMALFNNSSTLPSNALNSFLMNTKVTDASRIIFPTVTSQGCYHDMFQNCTSLVSAPALPATTLSNYCYYEMFAGCTSLVNAPLVLPATTLANSCYYGMFSSCTSLVTAPVISAITMANSCCEEMFYNCTSLTTVPDFVATTMANRSCTGMFGSCTSLVTAPALPAMTLAENCYWNMFQYCTSLINIPELPATTLADSCYKYMYNNCSSLKFSETPTSECPNEYRIPTEGTGTTATGALNWMFNGTGGTFTGTPSINTVYYTNSGAQIVNYFYLTFTRENEEGTPGSVTITNGGSGYFPSLLYSFDKSTWTAYTADTPITVNLNDTIYWKATSAGNDGINSDALGADQNRANQFILTGGAFDVGGDITTLLDENGGITDQFGDGSGKFAFSRIFQNQSDLEHCSNLVLPTTIGHTAFHYAFYNCSGLQDFPDFSHITKIGYNAFGSAFRETSCAGAVDFSAVTEYATLEGQQYQYAFNHTFRQSHITSAKFSSVTTGTRVFNSTFYSCVTIANIEVGWTSWGNSFVNNWLQYANGSGTFKCPTALGTNETISRGNSYVLSGWTVVNTD